MAEPHPGAVTLDQASLLTLIDRPVVAVDEPSHLRDLDRPWHG